MLLPIAMASAHVCCMTCDSHTVILCLCGGLCRRGGEAGPGAPGRADLREVRDAYHCVGACRTPSVWIRTCMCV